MPFGVQSAGFNTTTLKKLRKMLAAGEIANSDTVSRKLDIEKECVESHMAFYGYKNTGEPMSKADHEKHLESLAITKRSGKANALEDALQEAESNAKEIQEDQARKAAAEAEIAELQLAELKASNASVVNITSKSSKPASK